MHKIRLLIGPACSAPTPPDTVCAWVTVEIINMYTMHSNAVKKWLHWEVHGELKRNEYKNSTLCLTPFKDDCGLFFKSTFLQRAEAQLQASAWWSHLSPQQCTPNSFKLKVLLTMRESFIGSCGQELKITWAGTEREKSLSVWQDRIFSTERAETGFHWCPAPVSAICWPHPEVQSLVRDPAGTEACSGRRLFSWFWFINFISVTLRQGWQFNTSCSEVSCWRAEDWGQSAERETERKKLKNLSNRSQSIITGQHGAHLESISIKRWFVH